MISWLYKIKYLKIGQLHNTVHHSKGTHDFFKHITFNFICHCRQAVPTPLTKHFYHAQFASMRLHTSQCHLFFGLPFSWSHPFTLRFSRCPSDVFSARLHVPTKRCPCLLLQGIIAVGWQSFRPHTCSQCGKRFVSLNGLRLHEDLHQGRYQYNCSYCGKGFSGSTYLRSHLVTHTGIKEFRCKLCEREFLYARQLRQHVEVQHAVVMPSNVT